MLFTGALSMCSFRLLNHKEASRSAFSGARFYVCTFIYIYTHMYIIYVYIIRLRHHLSFIGLCFVCPCAPKMLSKLFPRTLGGIGWFSGGRSPLPMLIPSPARLAPATAHRNISRMFAHTTHCWSPPRSSSKSTCPRQHQSPPPGPPAASA